MNKAQRYYSLGMSHMDIAIGLEIAEEYFKAALATDPVKDLKKSCTLMLGVVNYQMEARRGKEVSDYLTKAINYLVEAGGTKLSETKDIISDGDALAYADACKAEAVSYMEHGEDDELGIAIAFMQTAFGVICYATNGSDKMVEYACLYGKAYRKRAAVNDNDPLDLEQAATRYNIALRYDSDCQEARDELKAIEAAQLASQMAVAVSTV